ncbi:MAG: UDP-N-acetylglucosamine 2-epimerase (non-hydrolyzing) [Patescibacteria group bacterium]
MKKICFILGTRPEIIKLSPLIRLCRLKNIPYFIIHTNQHYSAILDKIFFKELNLPYAKYNLNVGSANHGLQTASMIIAIEKIIIKEKPGCIIVEGDTNSVLAGAMAAAKEFNITIAHVEAGLRSYDRKMPEEINRIVADHISDILFAPTIIQKEILIKEGIPKNKILVTGNTIVDAVKINIEISNKKMNVLKKYNVIEKKYSILTLHRPSNVDFKINLIKIFNGLKALEKIVFLNKIIFLVHPRTLKNLNKFNIKLPNNIKMVNPVGYLEMLQLISKARLIFTDSGGIQEEACILKVPCITLRNNTERPETVKIGGNIIAGQETKKIISSTIKILNRKIKWKNPFGDGHSSEKMIRRIQPLL